MKFFFFRPKASIIINLPTCTGPLYAVALRLGREDYPGVDLSPVPCRVPATGPGTTMAGERKPGASLVLAAGPRTTMAWKPGGPSRGITREMDPQGVLGLPLAV